MYWGAKARYHDLNDVINELNPKMVEFHLTDEDVKSKVLKWEKVNIDLGYSIHLPEYWNGVMIDPCNLDNLKSNLDIYNKCIKDGLNIKHNFISNGKLKVIIHPGGASVDPVSESLQIGNQLYSKYTTFAKALNSEFSKDIELLVENMPPLPWFYGGQYYSNIFCDPLEIKYYCYLAGVGLCFDVSHMGLYCNYTGFNLVKAINILKPYIRQIHLADAEGTDGEGASIGAGNIDFKLVMQELKDLDVCCIPETMWGHKNNYAEFKKTIDVCNQYIGV